TVELTSGAKLLERLEKSLDSLPDINQERVDAVKTAIANGDYTIDADKIADALVRFDREFGR
ncbi:MAG: flagellar biosynthesis anti-sigma factor FlgM, partial [Woeseia sp.]|nr:flagellar biosynthesis anti-sigma factor FlgM [Woeseia sp.]